MKVTKNLLKTVVKECLIEILSEGFNLSSQKSDTEVKNVVSESRKSPKKETRRKTSDLIRFERAVKETSKNLTSDPVLSSIFEDTAHTTLQEQFNSPDSVVAGDSASYTASTNDPTDLFGESAGKWAALAFSDEKK